MSSVPVPLNELKRLALLRELCILDTPPDQAFDLITRLASQVFGVPIALIALIDQERQWFKSRVGMSVQETPRDQAFCAYAILQPEVMVVPDARHDARFKDNLLVTGSPNIRFYAGAPLTSREGLNLGTLCLIDTVPHDSFGPQEHAMLLSMAAMVTMRLESLRTIGYMDATMVLPNRARLLDDLEQHSQAGTCASTSLCAVAVDLCGAEYFNDMVKALGYRYADDYLLAARDRLLSLLPPETTLYRISTTRLGFILEREDEALADLLTSIGQACAEPLWMGDIPHNARVTMGTMRLPERFSPPDVIRALVSTSDSVRQDGGDWAFYDSRQHESQRRSFQVLSALSLVLNRGGDELALHYQPKVDLRTGRCVGVEALLRWNSPTLGPVSPAEFIPLAEKTALIESITQWVMAQALQQAGIWQRQGLNLTMAFNVSALDLDRPGFANELCTLIERHAVDPHRIELEFTESALTHQPERLRQHLLRLRALGVKVAIDDFGTGYSNLTYLKTLSADALKVDQSFVRNLLEDATDQAIVPALVRLAHEIKHTVVAEGIETEAAYQALAHWGCDEGQGYWIAKPMPVLALEHWLGSEPGRWPGLHQASRLA
ncbi:MAG TPA: sensor domain-containing phosphodiesterase [Candidatus Aquabacterium excrementipullorum]|nr:sensor domain-containing phosphodiesterase [Candidatus Aquabacterium excrementipullorum]